MLYKNVLSRLLGCEAYWTVAKEYSQQVGEALRNINVNLCLYLCGKNNYLGRMFRESNY